MRVPVYYNSNYEVDEFGNVYNAKTNRKLKSQIYRGYHKVFLFYNGSGKWYSVHRIVLASFKGINPYNPQVNHIDGNKDNNHLNNLEWCTHSKNVRHAIDNNLKHQNAKEVACYDLDMNYIATFDSCTDAERKLHIEHSLVSRCCRGVINSTRGYIFKFTGNVGRAEVITNEV